MTAASSQKHTPGPWQATWCSAEKAWAVEQSNRGPFVALLNTEPDARLIAEAPAMLAALERACNAYEALLASTGAQCEIGSENAPDTAGDWVKRRMADAMAEARAVAVAAGRGNY